MGVIVISRFGRQVFAQMRAVLSAFMVGFVKSAPLPPPCPTATYSNINQHDSDCMLAGTADIEYEMEISKPRKLANV